MTNFYVFSAPARQDIEEISDFIGFRNPLAAVRFLERINEQCKLLANFPSMGRRWDDLIPPLRSFPVDSYLIFYRPIEDGIEVVRVVSGYRDIDSVFPRQEEE